MDFITDNTLIQTPLLDTIDSPKDLRQLKASQLPRLAEEIRHYLIHCLDQCGGHLAANLGSVELTIALHYLYNTPVDQLIWDVGHQAYVHKLLTGRRQQLNTIKQVGGLAPFPRRSESEYDAFGTGHSSTSISAALGMTIAAARNNDPRRCLAIIGDGGLTGGMAFEALNHAGDLDPNFLVILNDNEMSISENVGALTRYFGRLIAGKTYANLRESSKKILTKLPPLFHFAKRSETHVKGMVTPGTLFEELGFNYVGPIDGHDLDVLLASLRSIKDLQGCKLLHVMTRKGKGYAPAEQDPIRYHGVAAGFYSKMRPVKTLTPSTPAPSPGSPTCVGEGSERLPAVMSYSDVFGNWLCDMAKQDPRLMAITPAMREGSGMVRFAKEYPEHYFDVGIAEQHAMTFAAGLACQGKKPVVAMYSTFLQRAYDQLIHDVAIQNLDVTLAIDRAGIVGPDGATHTGSFDLSFLRCIPNLVIMTPSDENECRQMLYTAYQHPGPAAVRYPKDIGTGVPVETAMQALPLGKARLCRQGKKIALLVFGTLLSAAMEAAEALDASVMNMRFVKPLDVASIMEIAYTHDLIVTIEENACQGGAGSAINEVLSKINHPPILNLGLPDTFLEHGSREVLLAECGLDSEGIIRQIKQQWLQFESRASASVA